ncbi:hypothetical protein Y032_0323g2480 [Ancylostoma ceylanicum]|uniref:Uncharacterized protein n=1 Tax=Ancylostoma ceylanicum TaxID=53326 RepID=A0A016S0C4_9BILA|nr:hypothetical protein Y032_0323g2480 [Ancylostoma ceylanicum]
MVRIVHIHCARPPTAMALTGASGRWKAGMAATGILVSLQVGRNSLCFSHICDVLTLYFTTRTSAPSRGFELVLPLTASFLCKLALQKYL